MKRIHHHTEPTGDKAVSTPRAPFFAATLLMQILGVKIGRYRDQPRALSSEEIQVFIAHEKSLKILLLRITPIQTALQKNDPGFYQDLCALIRKTQAELDPALKEGRASGLSLGRIETWIKYLGQRVEAAEIGFTEFTTEKEHILLGKDDGFELVSAPLPKGESRATRRSGTLGFWSQPEALPRLLPVEALLETSNSTMVIPGSKG